MAITALLFGADQRTKFQSVADPKKGVADGTDMMILDVTKTIVPKYSSTVTDHPVEAGRNISDHIRPNNIEITLEGYVSESPINLQSSIKGLISSAAGLVGSRIGGSFIGAGSAVAGGIGVNLLLGSGSKAELTRDFLIGLIEDKTQFKLAAPSLTKKITDAVYVMTSVSFPRDANTGRGIAFSCTIRQIRIVSSVSVTIAKLSASISHSAATKAKLGGQTAKAASDGSSSLMKKTVAFLKGN